MSETITPAEYGRIMFRKTMVSRAVSTSNPTVMRGDVSGQTAWPDYHYHTDDSGRMVRSDDK